MFIRPLVFLFFNLVTSYTFGQTSTEIELIEKANHFDDKEMPYEAFICWRKALEHNLKHEPDTNTIGIYSRIGEWHDSKGKYNLSLENHQNSYKAAVFLKDSFEMAGCMSNIGCAHMQLSNTATAIEYLEDAYRLGEIMNNQTAQVISLSNLASIHSSAGNFTASLKSNLLCLEVFEEMGIQNYVIGCKISITGNYIDLKEYGVAEKYLIDILQDSTKNIYSTSFSHVLYSEILYHKGEYDGALNQAEKARLLSEENELLQVEMMSYGAKSTAYAKKNQYEEAYNSLQKYHSLRDSMKGIDEIAITKEIDAVFKLSEHKRELIIYAQRDSLNSLQKQQNLLVTERIKQGNQFLIAFIIVLLILVGIVAWAYQNKRKAALELKHAKENAESQKKITEQFLTHTSHEIRTPLHIINSNVAELNSKYQPEKKEAIQASAEMLLRIANDILEVSRLESGNLVLENISFSPEEVFLQIKNMLFPECKAKDIALEFEFAQTVPKVLINDPARIKQVVLNVIKNAIKFTDFGFIKVKIDYRDKHLNLEVRDTGIGMTQSTLNNLFKSFNQGKLDTYRKFGGSGLGLFISHNLVKLMNGAIQITSEPNIGTNVKINIPCQKSEELFIENPWIEPCNYSKLSAFILDDDQMSRNVLKNYLDKLKIESKMFSTGHETLSYITKSDVNLVFIDLNLLGEKGTEIAKQIKQISAKTPVIITSGELLSNQLDFFDYQLEKPFNLIQLQDAIHTVINRQSLEIPIENETNELDELTIETFKEELPQMVNLAKKHFQLDDYEKVKFYIHKMKPCFYYVNAHKEFNRLAVIESTFDALKPYEIKSVIEEIEQMNLKVKNKLK